MKLKIFFHEASAAGNKLMLSPQDKPEAGQGGPLAGPPAKAETVHLRPEEDPTAGEEEHLQGEEVEEEQHLAHLAKVHLLVPQQLQGLVIGVWSQATGPGSAARSTRIFFVPPVGNGAIFPPPRTAVQLEPSRPDLCSLQVPRGPGILQSHPQATPHTPPIAAMAAVARRSQL